MNKEAFRIINPFYWIYFITSCFLKICVMAASIVISTYGIQPFASLAGMIFFIIGMFSVWAYYEFED